MVSDNIELLRLQLERALELRWKQRVKYRVIVCGPENTELIESGVAVDADVYATEEDYAKLETREKIFKNIFSKAAHSLAPYFPIIDPDDIERTLERFRFELHFHDRTLKRIEHSKDAKADLRKLAEKAYELAATMLELREGAKEILARNRHRVAGTDVNGNPLRGTVSLSEWQELREYGDIYKDQSSEDSVELSFTPWSGLLEDAESFNFPWIIPYDPDRYEHDDGLHDYEWGLGGPWIVRLRALAELAELNAKHLEEVTGKGGRINLGSRLHGSPQDYLAIRCREYAEAHGCSSQAVVLKMVQAVLEAEYGREAMRRNDGKPSRDKGRKAVRKVAQTQAKEGAV